jgi:hypothetical protein
MLVWDQKGITTGFFLFDPKVLMSLDPLCFGVNEGVLLMIWFSSYAMLEMLREDLHGVEHQLIDVQSVLFARFRSVVAQDLVGWFHGPDGQQLENESR